MDLHLMVGVGWLVGVSWTVVRVDGNGHITEQPFVSLCQRLGAINPLI